MSRAKPAPAQAPTRFHNFTDAMLADEFGAIGEELETVQERQEEARLEMTRRGKWALEGRAFVVTKSTAATASIDTAAIRTEMGDDWVAQRSKRGTRTTYRTGRKGEGAAQPAAKPRRARKPATADAA